ncbi:MAG: ABC transporter ATP-binding protein [Gordonia sp. (in: high G+C Gram-positive bacteria)]|uniref:ABC transporter ATP-binding protein n=1 Tax=Gordonia sp. (in: high G+C Gram-positive bacteria) TaxID=84139 RepID=UPI0039E3E328
MDVTRTAPRTKAVRFSGVGKQYATGAPVLDDIDLDVAPGEFVTVVGPSGCGKSTLLRLAAGLTAPSTGEIEVPSEAPGMVFQDASLLPWRSVLANVELTGEIDRQARDDRRRQATEALTTVGLAEFSDRLPARLSGGQRMRVSIARALVGDPGFLLFDEPFGALDEITRETLQDELARIVADTNVAALFITHSVPEAVYLGNRVVVMSAHPGRIVADVTVDAPTPREHDFRFTAHYADVCGQVSNALAEGHR